MKLLAIIACSILAISAATDEDLWLKFKEDHSKVYKSFREEVIGYEVFKSNLRTIEEHNARYERGEETWFMRVNQFADLTNEEFKKTYLNSKPPTQATSAGLFKLPLNASVPDAIDWRDKGVVLSVKNQGECGSCWAFSAVASLEGQNAIKHNIKEDLSEQELVDCSGSYENEGCQGGWMDNAFKYVKDHGISTASDYQYVGKKGTCKSKSNSSKIKLTGFKDIDKNEEDLREAVGTVGPISVAINADWIQFYGGGIFNNFLCFSFLNHGVLAVGYGTAGLHDFWIVKNSWGASWGEQGYIRMTRNRFNQCGIASQSSYPIIE